jgi:5-methylthioadenosine/S-adenosylhomocysteine deaminase
VADELDARVAMESPPLQRLHSLGLLRPGFAAIPQEAWSDAESELVATTGICVIACLQSDLRLGGGGASGSKLVEHAVGLGSGDPTNVGAIDMLQEARTAVLLGGGSVTAADALRLATLGGATALGFGADTGSIEAGKYADLVCIDLNRLSCQPTSSVSESVLLGSTREQVSDVWTSGRVAVSDGRLLAFDTQELMSSAQKWLGRLGGGT